MQKFYTLLLAALTFMSASAASPAQTKSFKKMPANAVKFENFRVDRTKTIRNQPSAMMKAPIKNVEDYTPIFNPQGTGVNYSVTSTRYELVWGDLIIDYSSVPTHVVFGDDNKVYIRDIITPAYSGVYVEGTRDGDKITVKLPQLCYSYTDEEGYTEEFLASKMEYYTYEKNGMTYMGYRSVAEEDNYVVYNINADGDIELDLNHGDPTDTGTAAPYIIGLCADATPGLDNWYGYGILYQSFTPFTEVANVLPEGVETETWALISDDGADGYVQVGFDEDHVYITGIGEYFNDAVLIGKIEGDKIVFDTPQYLGDFYGFFIWFLASKWTNSDWEDYELLDRVELNYDAENKVISTDDELLDFVFSSTADEPEALEYITNPTFMYVSEDDINAAPEDPFVVYFDHYSYRDYMEASEGYIEWIIPNINVNGCLLDTERMYYNFYIDGKVVTFSNDIYEWLDKDLTDIPYDYQDGMDIQTLDTAHFFTFKCENYNNFGLQSFYVGTDGVTYASNLVTYTPETSALSSFTGKTLQRAEFFDLQGRPIANPEVNGVYIMRSTFADGTTTVAKIMRK